MKANERKTILRLAVTGIQANVFTNFINILTLYQMIDAFLIDSFWSNWSLQGNFFIGITWLLIFFMSAKNYKNDGHSYWHLHKSNDTYTHNNIDICRYFLFIDLTQQSAHTKYLADQDYSITKRNYQTLTEHSFHSMYLQYLLICSFLKSIENIHVKILQVYSFPNNSWTNYLNF